MPKTTKEQSSNRRSTQSMSTDRKDKEAYEIDANKFFPQKGKTLIVKLKPPKNGLSMKKHNES